MTKEALEYKVKIADAGDVKIEPMELKLLARLTFNLLNVITIGFYKISIVIRKLIRQSFSAKIKIRWGGVNLRTISNFMPLAFIIRMLMAAS